MTGIKAGGKTVKIVGYGCGDDTPATALKETRRLMQQLNADVIVGPLSGDEAVAIANWAKSQPTKTFIIGTAGSQDPTLQIAPKNVFRYHGDGAQWNAGIGEIVYKKLGWRNAAIIMDDYSFGWTSAAGIIADFCAIGGKITKRVFPPLNTTDYSSYVRQLPAAGSGRRVLLGRRRYRHRAGTEGVRAGVRPHQADAALGEPVPLVPDREGRRRTADDRRVRRRLRHGTGPEVKGHEPYEAIVNKWYPGQPADDGFFYNYYQAAWALDHGPERLQRSGRGAAAERPAADALGSVRAFRQG